jgi:hypothetical protein
MTTNLVSLEPIPSSAVQSDAATVLLNSLEASAAAWRQIADLELAGRAMVTFMRGHMAEMVRNMSALEYFRTYYSELAREFVQSDDDGFVTHHCLRTLYGVWQAEMSARGAGALGGALSSLGTPLPVPASAVSPGRKALAQAWYDDVLATLESGGSFAPLEGNPMMPADECVLNQKPDLLWVQFLLWSTTTWARQIVALWQSVQHTILLRRSVEEQLGAKAVSEAISSQATDFESASHALSSAFGDWRTAHIANVEIHDSMPRGEYYGAIFKWLQGLDPNFGTWTIKEPLKTEMYRELAPSIAYLRGEPVTSSVPALRYWRRTPWTPACIRVGVAGLPPFTQ